jgi:hypothetical protein
VGWWAGGLFAACSQGAPTPVFGVVVVVEWERLGGEKHSVASPVVGSVFGRGSNEIAALHRNGRTYATGAPP